MIFLVIYLLVHVAMGVCLIRVNIEMSRGDGAPTWKRVALNAIIFTLWPIALPYALYTVNKERE